MGDKPREQEADVLLGLPMDDWEFMFDRLAKAHSNMLTNDGITNNTKRLGPLLGYLEHQYRRQRAALGVATDEGGERYGRVEPDDNRRRIHGDAP